MEDSNDVNYKLRYEEISLELREFIDSSRLVEAEYDRQIQELETQLEHCLTENKKLKIQMDNLKKSHQDDVLGWNKQQLEFQQTLVNKTDLLAKSKDQVRYLQNENDLLITSLRESQASEQRSCENYNQILEKLAIMETRQGEKDAMISRLNRMRQIIMEEDGSFEERHKDVL